MEKENFSPLFKTEGKSTLIIVWFTIYLSGLLFSSTTYSILKPPSNGSVKNSFVKPEGA